MRIWMAFCLSLLLLVLSVCSASAQSVLGIHVLNPDELSTAAKLLATKDGSPHYITVPFTFNDMNNPARWNDFFRNAKDANLIPLLRLTTRFENGKWVAPTRADIMHLTAFLSSLDWREDNLTVILFNEPNHANEWEGRIDPEGYARIADFAIDWFKTEPKNYTVLPAGLDLAAPNGTDTMEAFTFWRRAAKEVPGLFDKLDGWTSHSYPNPGFAANPWKTDQKSLRGYTHELVFLSGFTQKQLPVYITETGWNHDALTSWEIQRYYEVAYNSIWNRDPRIKAVTPFLLQGAPGTFAPFSFLDAFGRPNRAYAAYQEILGNK